MGFCPQLWGSNALLSSECGGADTVVGVAKVTLYLAPPGLGRAGWGPWTSCLHPPSFHSVYHK